MMNSPNPTRPIVDAAKQWGDNPVWMLNLLQFRNPYPGAGRDAYRRYVYEVRRTLADVGGRLVAASFNVATFIGEQRWDGVILVEYPSMNHLVRMVSSPGYAAISHWREDALSDFGFIALHPRWTAAADPNPIAAHVAPMSEAGVALTQAWDTRRWYDEPHAFRDTEGHGLSGSLLENPGLAGRLWCINLLKFKPDVGTHPDMPDADGADTYMNGYGIPVTRLISEAFGGTFILNDRSPLTVLGPKNVNGDDLGIAYDMVAIAQYPSRDAFLSMTHSPEYRRLNEYREAGLEMQQLISLSPEAVVLEDGLVVGDDAALGATRALLTAPL